ncbi:MAG: hypothetical protein NC218_08375 [Acetobacter sp.]|nr:hypothetical protein [Acetobacter sp.]
MISEGLHNVIENLYLNTNTLERTDEITTIPGMQEYGVEGIIRYVELIKPDGCIKRIPYADYINPLASTPENNPKAEPTCYTIKKGYMKLHPVPDKEYKLRIVLSSDDLVVSNDDTYKKSVTDIDDQIIGSQDFAKVVVLRATALIFIRCNNILSETYAQLANSALRSYIEKDYGSNEAQRGFRRQAGHYNPRRGLLG